MANSADPDQLASEEANDLDQHFLQRQSISGFSRTIKNKIIFPKISLTFVSCAIGGIS